MVLAVGAFTEIWMGDDMGTFFGNQRGRRLRMRMKILGWFYELSDGRSVQ